ncbi:IclR family transcriptional regulator [Providencia rettgeri]|uniref:IclR family transcriptional regulator n=1 Tax=Providencia TaxID=586 RepID=UPI001C82A21B|nr:MULTISPECIES: IclR family transcriptional regulator [Providencia]EIU7555424.1 IclR family transcriptional regulator [Providencia rettgeri]ELR5132830.1 IclR family transcriptional regulator [Providencia rettgeri]MBX6966913.1 IclR family transcriptional regulator [Providencia rettgeri]MBX6974935.1 IclR family transcriptional regulator [Providencia rettgeri]MBX6994197.1 IclR family transcriptional regulator [Providencia rettgeri]
MSSTCKYLIPGLEKGLQLLLLLAQQHRELTFAEILRLVDMPKATAYRAIQTLVHLDFLVQHPRTGAFSLGRKVLSLGLGYIASLDLTQLGQPIIEQLRDRSQCNSHLVIRDGTDIIYIARVSGAESKINHVSVGTRLSAHRTSLGRMLLSGLNRTEFDALYPHDELPDNAGSKHEFWQMIQADKLRGYVIGESFYRRGISSIVYPVYNQANGVEAVISIMVPMNSIPAQERQRLQNEVSYAAQRLTEFIGGMNQAKAV